jgi:hypothetical protein
MEEMDSLAAELARMAAKGQAQQALRSNGRRR